MFLIQVWSRAVADEELGAIGVGSSIGHRQNALVGMWKPDSLIFELLSVDAFASSAIAVGGISSLHHKTFDDSVELDALVVAWLAFLSSADGAEVFGRLWYFLVEHLEHDSTFLVAFTTLLADRDIEVRLYIILLEFGQTIMLRRSTFLLIIDALLEELGKCLLLASSRLRPPVLDNSVVGA